ncbi:hypothetical protein MAR_007565 [Mya arenaria]|uniref:Uncharacterized protein n=1 Tax=Mya arenaria TaxID=6604 RepID=A0ABY7DCR5_MYAAR|nr:hypothetical protein MAR_007565 [Mya arenaria]
MAALGAAAAAAAYGGGAAVELGVLTVICEPVVVVGVGAYVGYKIHGQQCPSVNPVQVHGTLRQSFNNTGQQCLSPTLFKSMARSDSLLTRQDSNVFPRTLFKSMARSDSLLNSYFQNSKCSPFGFPGDMKEGNAAKARQEREEAQRRNSTSGGSGGNQTKNTGSGSSQKQTQKQRSGSNRDDDDEKRRGRKISPRYDNHNNHAGSMAKKFRSTGGKNGNPTSLVFLGSVDVNGDLIDKHESNHNKGSGGDVKGKDLYNFKENPAEPIKKKSQT